MSLYVFRIAKGHDGGEPTNECPIDMKDLEPEIKAELSKIALLCSKLTHQKLPKIAT